MGCFDLRFEEAAGGPKERNLPSVLFRFISSVARMVLELENPSLHMQSINVC